MILPCCRVKRLKTRIKAYKTWARCFLESLATPPNEKEHLLKEISDNLNGEKGSDGDTITKGSMSSVGLVTSISSHPGLWCVN
jgi:hypothetical protein